ncbi:stage II sporulation protein M [Novosphingobium sp. FKTRR1]|uniref:stage II sporulation protein M n=1 Tax=Novosphingobium sp. FKTRR1 TaxID=2879118 RepID=UPI001CF0253D|nr:stage II sporulation protein M [Novosphingobium sp. FKTRR1]
MSTTEGSSASSLAGTLAGSLSGTVSGWFGRSRAAAVADIETAALRSDRFRLAREGDWQRLEAIVARIERGRLRGLSDDDLLALPVLYRTVASSLAIARETSLDQATLAYLEALVQRAWFVVYGPREGLGAWVRRFFGGGWGASVRALGSDVLIALALMVAGTIAGYLLVAGNADWYYALVPGSDGDARVPGASRAALLATLFGQQKQEGLSIFAAYLFSNNAQVSILAFALGFAFGLPSILLLVHNTAMLGALLWLYHGQGLDLEIVGWLSVHGTTELFAILLAGASGIHIGRAMAFPGDRSVLDAAAQAGRRTAQVMVGVVLMLIVAALLEGFARQLLDSTASRLIVGGFMLVFWIGYFFAWRRDRLPLGEDR